MLSYLRSKDYIIDIGIQASTYNQKPKKCDSAEIFIVPPSMVSLTSATNEMRVEFQRQFVFKWHPNDCYPTSVIQQTEAVCSCHRKTHWSMKGFLLFA